MATTSYLQAQRWHNVEHHKFILHIFFLPSSLFHSFVLYVHSTVFLLLLFLLSLSLSPFLILTSLIHINEVQCPAYFFLRYMYITRQLIEKKIICLMIILPPLVKGSGGVSNKSYICRHILDFSINDI